MDIIYRTKHYIGAAIRRVPFLKRLSNGPAISQGEKGIKEVGHRRYVGGKWDKIGRHQFRFLVDKGMQPSDVLLDIACGSFRLGVHAIDYLNEGMYMGVEKEKELVKRGINREVGKDKFNSKKPEVLISDSFEFEKLSKKADYAIAQSLFSHLPKEEINSCLNNLRRKINKDGVFYATYFESNKESENPQKQHDHRNFKYSKKEMRFFGEDNGWSFEYIGDWGHPRGQVMTKYIPR